MHAPHAATKTAQQHQRTPTAVSGDDEAGPGLRAARLHADRVVARLALRLPAEYVMCWWCIKNNEYEW